MKNILSQFSQIISPGDLKNLPTGVGSEDGTIVTDGLQILFAIAAAVAMLIIAISSFRIVMSRGNAQDISKSRDAIIYASIGLGVCLLAFTIVTYVVANL